MHDTVPLNCGVFFLECKKSSCLASQPETCSCTDRPIFFFLHIHCGPGAVKLTLPSGNHAKLQTPAAPVIIYER